MINTNSPLNDLPEMTTYSEKTHPNLYNEIVKDWNYRWGKFSAINYPIVTPKDTNPTPLLPKPIRKLPQ